ncbi:MAG TPA: head GIN domain-containing protein [Bacteroidales bacterium]|nr:head GIN domain-containing protein [Bacteroidales bacterium]
MKAIKLLIIAGLLLSVNLYSQKIKSFKVEAFNQLEVYGKFDIELKKSSEFSVKLYSDNIDLSKVDVVVENKKMKISALSGLFKKNSKVSVTIEYDSLNSLLVTNGAEIYSSKPVQVNNLKLVAGNGSTVNLKFETESFTAYADKGATINAEGKSKFLDIEVASGGIMNGFEFICDSADVRCNAGGMVKINAKRYLKAAASTGGEIIYRGKPVLNQRTTLGGKIEQMKE